MSGDAAVPRIDDWNRLLDGRVAVVTGGGDGIGAGIARLFAAHGALVEVAEIDRDRAERITDEVTAAGGSIRGHVTDVTVDDDVARLAEAVLTRHGRVDVLVNNVGDYRPLVPFHRSTPDSWQRMYDINLRHVLSVTRAFVPSMIDAHRGSIVTVHSVEGMRGYPKDPVYGAMKAAAAHFTTCLAVDLGRRGIRVNGIGTDLAQTPQVDYLSGYEDTAELWASWAPVGRVGWPEDQARVALFLASDQSAFVTGHNIPVDGGTKAGGGWLFSPREGRFVNRSRNL
ncbi:SDR family oxidoreductase [Mycobacterium sp. B14F4]|uniref:SDR family NAD(P)-dependent oxidoreductase n=1 Tax=Mycobacterium sp. B14F4 TaxID=3153565 RepID=UPI00325D7688